MAKRAKPVQKRNEQVGRNLVIWLAVSAISWAVYVTGGGALVGVWSDVALVAVAIYIFRYVWQSRKPAKGWNASSLEAGVIAVVLCMLWLVVLAILYTSLPKSGYFG